MTGDKQATSVLALAGAFFLTACFGAEGPLIPEGEGVLPLDGEITLCPEDESSCFSMSATGDGYATPSDMPPGDRGTARFAPLMVSDGIQIFILELRPDNEQEVLHLIARRASGTSPAPASLDVAPPDCSDLQGEALEIYEAAGGEVSTGLVSNCRSPDLETLRQALRSTYRERFDDDDWWIEASH